MVGLFLSLIYADDIEDHKTSGVTTAIELDISSTATSPRHCRQDPCYRA